MISFALLLSTTRSEDEVQTAASQFLIQTLKLTENIKKPNNKMTHGVTYNHSRISFILTCG